MGDMLEVYTMRLRFIVLIVAVAATALLSTRASGQAPSGAKAGAWTAARTPWGHPDLQGTWNAATLTPLERPDTAAGKLSLTQEEAAAIAKAERDRVEARAQPSNPNRPVPVVGGNVGGYNNFWIDRGSSAFVVDGQHRTSIIIDPADGKIPPTTPEAQRRNRGARGSVVLPTSDAAESAAPEGRGAFDDVELRPLAERCILAFGSTSGPPSLPNYFYNNNKQIVQTPDSVLILVEMVHDARIVRLNSQHPPSHIRKWMGDSIGRWEGDTLVVETTNFTNKTRFRGSSENMKVIERFRRVDEKTILYRFTIEDPATWTRSWSGEYPWESTNDQIYEYACHEGNYALGDILRGERVLDNERAAKQASEKK
jgi:hypothetical protein